jgi:hypothetical protein
MKRTLTDNGYVVDRIARRAVLGAAALSAASLVGLSGGAESYEKAELADLGATVFAKHVNGGIAGAELLLARRGRYLVEAFDTGCMTVSTKSLKKFEFTVDDAPHREVLPDWKPSTSVLIHLALMDERGRLATQAVALPR